MPDDAMEPGHIRIKLSQELSYLPDTLTEVDGKIEAFGIAELDELCGEYQVTSITRLFGVTGVKTKYSERHRLWGLHLWFEIEFGSQKNLRDIVMAFRELKDVLQWAEPEYKKTMLSVQPLDVTELQETLDRWTPNDTRYGEQWHYNNTGQTGGTVDADIDLPEAWNIEKGHQDVVVCVQDGGIQQDHPDLNGNLWINSDEIAGNGVDDDGNGYIDDRTGYNFVSGNATIVGHFHGTHVAGTIAAESNNSAGVAGVAGGNNTTRGVSLMSTQVFTDDSSGGHELAPIYAADNGACISQNSWGYTIVGAYDQSVLDAIDYFNANGGGTVLNGGLTIYAAGNSESSGQWYPGCYSGAFSVAATTHEDTKAWYSNYDTWVDVSAPGGETTVSSEGVLSTYTGSAYNFLQGTSMACPHTSGVAALVISYAHRNGRTMSNTEVANIIRNTTDDHYAVNPSYTGMLGSGRINAYAALLAVDPTLPSCSITSPVNGTVFDLNSSVTVNVTATDTDGTITGVGFYINDVLQYTDSSSPYSWVWNTTGLSGGAYTIKAVATDNSSHTAQDQVSVTLLAPPDEGFETGNFGAYAWVNSSAVPWTVQSSEKFSGTYAAKSGTITHNGTTTISLPAIVSSSGNISFYYKVSSESTYDWLRFYIDGVQQAEWSGTAGWAAASYPVTSGSRTFAWTYSKDGSVSSGSDCAWIDHIIFPPMETYYAPPQNFAATAGNAFVSLSWQAPASGTPTGYKIYRNSSLLTTVTGLSYTDNAVVNGTTYSYYLIAAYSGGNSDPTPTVQATPNNVVITEVILGSGTSSTTTSTACPVNQYYRSVHGQSVYTAAELNAQGVYGPITITHLGFNITALPAQTMPNFIVRIGHTNAGNAASWTTAANLTTVWQSASYLPTTTGWNMYTLNPPFQWNGTSNIVIDTGFAQIASWNQSGTTQYTTTTTGYRYTWNDDSDQTNVFSGGSTSNNRPNLKLSLQVIASDPLINISPSTIDFGDVQIGSQSTQTFTIQNPGAATLSGTITTPLGYTVSENTRSSFSDSFSSSRNSLGFSVNTGQTKSYSLSFDPTAVQSYNGNVVINSNAVNSPTVNIAVTGAGFIPPTVTLSTQSIQSSLLPDETDAQSFTIGNSGSQTLNYEFVLTEQRHAGRALRTAGDRDITGSTLTLDALDYIPGSTLNWTFTVTNASPDNEWLKDVYITFPTGVTVNSATNFVGGSGGDMTPDLTSGNGIAIHWNGIDANNWGVVRSNESAVATVNITISGAYSGDLTLPYQINGDVYGAEPHVLNGNIILTPGWVPLDWFDLAPNSGSVAPGGSVPITAYFDSAALTSGQYLATLLVNSNDPVHPQMTIDVTLNVQDPNQPPEIIPPDVIAFAKNDTYVEDFSPYVSDPDSDPLSLQASGNSHIQIAIDGLSVTFNAIDGWTGQEEVTFTVSDGDLEASAVVYVSSYNTPPTIDLPDEGFTFTRNGSLTVDLAPYGNDADGDELSIDFSGDTHIDVQLDGSSANFSSIDGWVGSEIITFSVFDGTDQTSDTVEITVTNSAPTLDLPDSWSFGHNSFLAVDMGLYGGDDDGDVLELTWIGNTNILIIQNGPTISLSSPDGWVGTENVTFTFNDGYAQTSDTVEIIATNSAPELTLPDGWSLPRNGTLEVDLAPFVTDYDGDPLIFGTSGTTNVETNFDGSVVTFYAPSGWVGTETVTFVINDGIDSGTDTAEITVTNSAPAFNLPTSWSFDQDTVGILDLNVYASDPEADALSYQFSGNVHIAIGIVDGILTATPDPGWYGTESITITVSDGLLEASDSWDIIVEQVISALDTPVVIISMTVGSVVLDWQSVPDATEYLILASADPYGIFTQIGSSVTNHFETPLTDDMAFFQVKALYEPEAK